MGKKRTTSTSKGGGKASATQQRKEGMRKVLMGFGGIVGAVTIAAAAMLWWSLAHPYTELSVSDPAQLKKVFYSGQPWLVLCQDAAGKMPSGTAVEKARRDLTANKINVGTLNCTATLPSGKTTVQKLKLNPYQKPVVFYARNGKAPVQVPAEVLKDSTELAKWAIKGAQLLIQLPRTTAELRKTCLSKKACGMLLTNGTLEAAQKTTLSRTMARHRTTPFAHIDVGKSKLSLQPQLFPSETVGPVFAIFVKNAKTKQTGVAAYRGAISSSNMAWFTTEAKAGRAQITWLPSEVTLSTTSKFKGKKSTRRKSSGAADSKAERKEARDRARQEAEDKARAGLTEEELRERERLRRQEMEAESSELIQDADDAEDGDGFGDGDEEEEIEIDADYDD